MIYKNRIHKKGIKYHVDDHIALAAISQPLLAIDLQPANRKTDYPGIQERKRISVQCHGQIVRTGSPKKRLDQELTVSIVAYPPDLRKRDIDNLFKAPLDCLTHAQVWHDDSQISALTIIRGKKIAGGRLDIAISINEEG